MDFGKEIQKLATKTHREEMQVLEKAVKKVLETGTGEVFRFRAVLTDDVVIYEHIWVITVSLESLLITMTDPAWPDRSTLWTMRREDALQALQGR